MIQTTMIVNSMKRIFSFALGLLCSIAVFSDPAWPDSVLVHQPDGTYLWVYDRGDEFYNWTESTDGFTIMRNNKGIFDMLLSKVSN